MWAACLLLVLVTIEVISWFAVSVHLRRFATHRAVRQAQLAVMALDTQTAQVLPATAEPFPGFATRDVIHPFLGFVYDRDFNTEWRRTRGGQEAVEFGFGLSEPGIFHDRSPDTLVVALTGGSMAFLLGGRSGQSLKQALQACAPPEVSHIRIVNLALPGYKQPQQLMVLNYFLTLGARFDLVVNLDGFNEITLPLMENIPKGVSPFYPRGWFFRVGEYDRALRVLAGEVTYLRSRRARIADTLGSLPLRYSMTAALSWFVVDVNYERKVGAIESKLVAATARSDQSSAVTGPRFQVPTGDAAYRDLARVWANSSLQMDHLARGGGFLYFHFLQPNQYVPGSKPMSAEESVRGLREDSPFSRHVRIGYPELVAEGEKLRARGVRFHDLTGVFADVPDPVYEDTCCHVGVEGERLIAEAMATLISRDLGPAPS